LDFPRQWVEFVNPDDEDEIFRIDLTWLLSSWTCIFGSGCKGIVKNRADDGCCSHGAFYAEKADEKRVEKFARDLTDDEWQYRKQGLKGGITEVEDGKRRTRRLNGACIFLNRPGFADGQGGVRHPLRQVREGAAGPDRPPPRQPKIVDHEQSGVTRQRVLHRCS